MCAVVAALGLASPFHIVVSDLAGCIQHYYTYRLICHCIIALETTLGVFKQEYTI